jgi:hypothetical protein
VTELATEKSANLETLVFYSKEIHLQMVDLGFSWIFMDSHGLSQLFVIIWGISSTRMKA